MDYTSDNSTLEILDTLSGPLYQTEVVSKRISLIDLLEVHESISLPFAEYLRTLPPMRLRYYSISSSPLRDPTTCSITYGVINAASKSGTSRFKGVTGNYLRGLRRDDSVQVNIRRATSAFHLPASPASTAILMFCNGTGIAPFHGFIQERATQLAANPNQQLAPALLFFGCRSPTADALYNEEFEEWVRKGIVDVRYTYSRDPFHPEAQGCKYVQERMLRDQEEIVRLWQAGAQVFICGTPDMVEGLKKTVHMLVEGIRGDMSPEDAESFFQGMKNQRLAVDILS